MIRSRAEKTFNVFNYIFLTVLGLIFLLPCILIVTSSLTSETVLAVHGSGLLIRKFSFEAYVYIFSMSATFVRSLLVSVFITVVTTVLAVVVNCLCAYPLSRPRLAFRKEITLFFVFTMLFSGGMIPSYLIVTGLGLKNTLWAVILPAIVSAWNMLLVRNYFAGIPDSLEESAKMDGANNLTVFIRIYFPLSMPIVATIALFSAVGQWNNWAGPLMYIEEEYRHLYPVQYLLREMLNNLQNVGDGTAGGGGSGIAPLENVKNASIVVATLPIVIVYPFIQKYFINGIMIGSVKG
jgi:putative aldouronate transport system permease protein